MDWTERALGWAESRLSTRLTRNEITTARNCISHRPSLRLRRTGNALMRSAARDQHLFIAPAATDARSYSLPVPGTWLTLNVHTHTHTHTHYPYHLRPVNIARKTHINSDNVWSFYPWVDEIRYLGIHTVAGWHLKCSVDNGKRSFYRSTNAIFGKNRPNCTRSGNRWIDQL